MPRRTIHRRRRAQGGCLSFAIAALAVVALALVVAIVVTNRLKPPADNVGGAAAGNPDGIFVDANNPPVEDNEMVLTAGQLGQGNGEIVVLTPSPTPEPEPTPSPEPTFNPNDPYALVRPQPTQEGFLPVFTKAYIDEPKIAITVDECSGAGITRKFADLALEYNAKLTLFPTGESVMKKGMDEALRYCFNSLEFEIENRCFSTTAKLYALNDTLMVSEIWKQSLAVSYVLGVKYHPHFLRLYGRDGENDLRTHTFLKQEGYVGIAGWTDNGSRMEEGRIGNNMAPGNIYYFKSNNDDLERMRVLMEEAKQQGYQMVTLNELFGYEPNLTEADVNVMTEEMPEIRVKNIPYYFMKTGDCTWATNLLQRRLTDLGYLPPDSADGVYGSSTAAALSAFQAKLGMAATGAADVLTQEKLFADDAPTVDER